MSKALFSLIKDHLQKSYAIKKNYILNLVYFLFHHYFYFHIKLDVLLKAHFLFLILNFQFQAFKYILFFFLWIIKQIHDFLIIKLPFLNLFSH